MNKVKTLVALGLAFFNTAVWAQSGYFAADLMLLDMRLTTSNTSSGANPTAVAMRVGRVIQEYFAMEGVLGLGITDDGFSSTATGKLKSLLAVNAVGRMPMGESAELYGQLGLAKMGVKISGSTISAGSYSVNGVLYAVGAVFELSRSGEITLEYARLPNVSVIGGNKVKTSSISVGYRLRY